MEWINKWIWQFIYFQIVQFSAFIKKTYGINGKLNPIWKSHCVSGNFSCQVDNETQPNWPLIRKKHGIMESCKVVSCGGTKGSLLKACYYMLFKSFFFFSYVDRKMRRWGLRVMNEMRPPDSYTAHNGFKRVTLGRSRFPRLSKGYYYSWGDNTEISIFGPQTSVSKLQHTVKDLYK